jgi:hypothetical protein
VKWVDVVKLLNEHILYDIASARIATQDISASIYDDVIDSEMRFLIAAAQELSIRYKYVTKIFSTVSSIKIYARYISNLARDGYGLMFDCSLEEHLNECLLAKRMIRDYREFTEVFIRMFDPRTNYYVSRIAKQNRIIRDRKADEYAEKHGFTNGSKVISLPKQAEIANRQYAQLLARSKGVLASAAMQGATNYLLVTITAPQQFHPNSIHYDPSLTAGDSHRYLQDGWVKFRANVAKTQAVFEFVKAVQPHKSSVAHFHVVIGTTMQTAEIERLLTLNFDGDANDYRAKHGIKVDVMTGGVDGAVAYTARTVKYLARAMAGESSADEEEALATKEWSSIYRIRRFTTSQDAVTVWRTMLKPECDISILQPLREARKAGDYKTFLQLVTALDIKPLYNEDYTSSGKRSSKVIGLAMGEIPLVKFDHFVKINAAAKAELQLIEKNQGTGHRTKRKLLILIAKLANFPDLRQKYQEIINTKYAHIVTW